MVINSSRAILYADPGAGFAQAAAQAAESTRNQIRAARTAAWTARSG
jgi:orotidine-5'-phosphate decarboxylase